MTQTLLGCNPPETFKICRDCKELKPLGEFNYHGKTKDNKYPICKPCRALAVRNNREQEFFNYIHTRKKAECRAKDWNYDLTPEYLESIWTGICPVLGVKLKIFDRYSDESYNLDRVRPELGYIQGNVNFISRRANWIKVNATPEELKAVLKYMEDGFKASEVWAKFDITGCFHG